MYTLWKLPTSGSCPLHLPVNPADWLDSKAMEHVLAMVASSDIEMIILDTRALLGLSDTCILAPSMDGIVVVVDITRANEKELKQVKTSVAQIGTCVLGCVVNKQRDSHTGTAYYDAAELRYEKIDTGMGLERDQNGTPGDMEIRD